MTGPVPPLTLLLAPNEAKPTQTTVIHHGAKWRIPKHHMTARDLPRVPHDTQSMRHRTPHQRHHPPPEDDDQHQQEYPPLTPTTAHIRHPPPNAGPAPQRGTPHPISTASRIASIPPLPPVPHADGTSSGTHSAGKQRHANSLPRIHKATPLTHPSDTALRTHRLETRTRPPGDGPSPTTNPTTGPQ